MLAPVGIRVRNDELVDRVDQRTFLLTLLVIEGVLILGVMSQFVVVTLNTSWFPGPGRILLRALANAVPIVLGLLVYRLRFARGWPAKPRLVLLIVTVQLATAALRSVLQAVFGLYPTYSMSIVLPETIGAALLLIAAALLALRQVYWRVSTREVEHERARRRNEVAHAVVLLQDEELRVRQEVADDLHGSLQGTLAALGTRLGRLGRSQALSAVDPAVREELAAIEKDLDGVREHDIRRLAQSFYPQGLDVGLTAAVRILLGRLPPGIAVNLELGEALCAADDPVRQELAGHVRLLAFRIVEEGVSNALRHGLAGSVDVRLDLGPAENGAGGLQLELEIEDDGAGRAVQDDGRPHTGGIARLAERASFLGGSVSLSVGERGAVLRASLPNVPLDAPN